jgi:hypothetical protein
VWRWEREGEKADGPVAVRWAGRGKQAGGKRLGQARTSWAGRRREVGLRVKEKGRTKQAGGLVRLPGPGRREGELGWARNGEG